MTFPVNGAIPQASDDPSISQGQILTNFSNIFGWSAVDHVQYGAANAGTHNQVTMLTPNVSDPSLSGAQGELYTKSISGVAQLFFANSQGTNQILPNLVSSGSNYGFKLGSMIINFGKVDTNTNPKSFTFAINMTNLFAITSGINNVNSTVSATFDSMNGTGGTVRCSQNNAVWYIAIGN